MSIKAYNCYRISYYTGGGFRLCTVYYTIVGLLCLCTECRCRRGVEYKCYFVVRLSIVRRWGVSARRGGWGWGGIEGISYVVYLSHVVSLSYVVSLSHVVSLPYVGVSDCRCGMYVGNVSVCMSVCVSAFRCNSQPNHANHEQPRSAFAMDLSQR